MDPIHGLDWGTYYFFRNQRMAGALNLQPVMLVGAELGSYLALGIIAVVTALILSRRGWPRAPLLFVVTAAAAVGLDLGLKRLVHRPRPPDAELWLGQAHLSFSFPSTSALLSSFLALLLARAWVRSIPNRRPRIFGYGICLAVVLFIGTSQLYLGLHFVTDLLAGWTAGTLLALLLVGFMEAAEHGIPRG
jgi:undecaprenyl-diphosphatase